jgi:adenylate kinase family enzyme
MRRIVILGCAGSGKSTLARRLGQLLGLPVVHLDVLYWRPGWTKPDIDEFRTRVAAAVASDGWISDGNYRILTFDLTLPRADAIIMLERPRWLCLRRVLWRSWSGRERPDLPAGCREEVDWELLNYVWNYQRLSRPRLEAARIAHAPDVPVTRLRSQREIDAFVASLPSVQRVQAADAAADRRPLAGWPADKT